MGKRISCSDSEIVEASKNTNSAMAAAASLGIQYGTYKRHAIRLGVFIKNQSGAGVSKPILDDRKIELSDILSGNQPQYQSNKLRHRLLKEGIKEHKCEACGITEWLGQPAPLELDHIDGNRVNHELKNLRLLCPNCHSQTDTYRSKNKKSRQ